MTNNFIKEIQEKGVRLSIGLQANIPINATFDKDMLVISKEVFDSLITHTALRTIEVTVETVKAMKNKYGITERRQMDFNSLLDDVIKNLVEIKKNI